MKRHIGIAAAWVVTGLCGAGLAPLVSKQSGSEIYLPLIIRKDGYECEVKIDALDNEKGGREMGIRTWIKLIAAIYLRE